MEKKRRIQDEEVKKKLTAFCAKRQHSQRTQKCHMACMPDNKKER